MFFLQYYDENKNLDKNILSKYISIMNIYDKGVIFFDLTENKAYINDKCEVIFNIDKNTSIIEKFIFDIEKVFCKGDQENAEIALEDLDINIKYSIKHLTEENKISYILCTIEQKVSRKNDDSNNYISKIIGKSNVMLELKDKIKIVGKYDSTILLLGQTGTGKELFAKAIHDISPRRNKRFIVVNCGAIPDSLLESELFGYEKGSFTGANSNGKIGKFETANGGTIFLDEIENMSQFMQNKILRVIEERKISRVGSNKEIDLDIRIVGATNINLKELVEENKFRKDLYYRFNVICFEIPSLMEREDDIFLIADYLIENYSKSFGKDIIGLNDQVRKVFKNYNWEGNIRELRNVIEYAINFENSKYITKLSLPKELMQENTVKTKSNKIRSIEEIEKEILERTLNSFGWNEVGKIKAAQTLGISRSSVYRRIAKYGLDHNISNTS